MKGMLPTAEVLPFQTQPSRSHGDRNVPIISCLLLSPSRPSLLYICRPVVWDRSIIKAVAYFQQKCHFPAQSALVVGCFHYSVAVTNGSSSKPVFVRLTITWSQRMDTRWTFEAFALFSGLSSQLNDKCTEPQSLLPPSHL